MGRLTDDMTRLVGEIQTERAARARTIRDVKHATAEMKRAVAGMQSAFRSAHAETMRRQQRMLRGFVSGLRATVVALRQGVADDLMGARNIWVGAAAAPIPGRARRGAKWFSGENA